MLLIICIITQIKITTAQSWKLFDSSKATGLFVVLPCTFFVSRVLIL